MTCEINVHRLSFYIRSGALNSLGDDEWFEVSDDIIERVGYKGTVARMDNILPGIFQGKKMKVAVVTNSH